MFVLLRLFGDRCVCVSVCVCSRFVCSVRVFGFGFLDGIVMLVSLCLCGMSVFVSSVWVNVFVFVLFCSTT